MGKLPFFGFHFRTAFARIPQAFPVDSMPFYVTEREYYHLVLLVSVTIFTNPKLIPF